VTTQHTQRFGCSLSSFCFCASFRLNASKASVGCILSTVSEGRATMISSIALHNCSGVNEMLRLRLPSTRAALFASAPVGADLGGDGTVAAPELTTTAVNDQGPAPALTRVAARLASTAFLLAKVMVTPGGSPKCAMSSPSTSWNG
jgi:hypothetical protein